MRGANEAETLTWVAKLWDESGPLPGVSPRQCCVGTELVDWQMQQSSCVRSRLQAVGMWQVLLEEGVLNQGETLRLGWKPLCVRADAVVVTQWTRS